MRNRKTGLLAVAAAAATLLGLIAVPASAADPREATASLYAFIGSGDQEAITIENQEWSRPDWNSGRTPSHPGWSIHLSDERLGAGLPRQDFTARAEQTPPYLRARTRGFISVIDQNTSDVPFVVVKLPERGVGGCDFAEVPLDAPRLFVRKNNGELHESDVTKPAVAEGVTSADSATDTTKYSFTVEVKQVTTAAQITPYGPFWKYAGRQAVRTNGHEIVLTQQGATPKTYRLLAGGTALSC